MGIGLDWAAPPAGFCQALVGCPQSRAACSAGRDQLTTGLAGAPAGGREPVPLMCTVALGHGTHSLLSCQRTILDPVELAGVPEMHLSLCVNYLSLASSPPVFVKEEEINGCK